MEIHTVTRMVLLRIFFGTTYTRRMSPLDRRRFLAVTAATVASLKTFAEPASQISALTLHPEEAGSTIPFDFMGLSYEMQQITVPDFFSPENEGVDRAVPRA